MGKDEPEFSRRNAQLLGISRDSLEAHARFALKAGAKFPLLTDPDGAVAKRYGATMPLVPLTARKLFIIDRRGIIRWIVEGMPDDAQLLSKLDELEQEPS